jgi:hypothetical protein
MSIVGHINSFDDDGLKWSCAKHKASEWPHMQNDKHSEK